jgi:phosphoglucomutase
LDRLGVQTVGSMKIEIVDSVEDYVQLMKEIFDFNMMKSFLKNNSDFKILFDGMHGGLVDYFKKTKQ